MYYEKYKKYKQLYLDLKKGGGFHGRDINISPINNLFLIDGPIGKLTPRPPTGSINLIREGESYTSDTLIKDLYIKVRNIFNLWPVTNEFVLRDFARPLEGERNLTNLRNNPNLSPFYTLGDYGIQEGSTLRFVVPHHQFYIVQERNPQDIPLYPGQSLPRELTPKELNLEIMREREREPQAISTESTSDNDLDGVDNRNRQTLHHPLSMRREYPPRVFLSSTLDNSDNSDSETSRKEEEEDVDDEYF